MDDVLPSVSVRRLLIVDDEPHVRKFLRLALEAEGFTVFEAASADGAIVSVRCDIPDLIVLDLGLPDLDGTQVIRDVRLSSDVPILVLSGRTEDSEKIAALDHGADSYVAKPFVMRDLVFQVRSVLLRRDLWLNRGKDGYIVTGPLRIHLQNSEVYRDEKPVELEPAEYDLIRMLAANGGRILTVRRLERELWGREGDQSLHVDLQRHIHNLRRKLETEPSFPRYIVTEPSIGYRLELVPPVQRHPQ